MLENIKNHIPQNIYPIKEYAVCIPLIKIDNEYHILFEKRASYIQQPSEICFPGGKIEKEDINPLQGALRECKEELNIEYSQIELYGELNYYEMNGIKIHVFLIELMNYSYTFNEEVESVFTIPFSFFNKEPEIYDCDLVMRPKDDFPYHLIPNKKEYKFRQTKIDTPFYIYQDKIIWGLTARILYHNLSIIQKNM